MNKLNARTKVLAFCFAAALLWRMLGAPMNAEDLNHARMSFWQARTLLPDRAVRIFDLWLSQSNRNAKSQESKHEADIVSVYVNEREQLVEMQLNEYVCGVVAAEMPAQYHLEALKAQSVAAYTRLLWQKMQGGCSRHMEADICTDPAHCQGYAAPEECREKWGTEYQLYRERIQLAQNETEGQWIAYDEQPIAVVYHAISGGRTENAQAVFLNSVPYLVSVASSNEESVRGFQQETKFTFAELIGKLNQELPDMSLTQEELRRTFSICSYTESGRVKSVQVGECVMDAAEFRRILGLRSTNFSISSDENGITFYQKGYGHGVGMSQAGANVMASSGADYKQILTHYYTGVKIVASPV